MVAVLNAESIRGNVPNIITALDAATSASDTEKYYELIVSSPHLLSKRQKKDNAKRNIRKHFESAQVGTHNTWMSTKRKERQPCHKISCVQPATSRGGCTIRHWIARRIYFMT
jgi:hypothetical protein